ncbi:transmembrane protein 222-like [Hydra vulgaris]|uniref:Transmembrane protein 222-like n=1 Tax=Hydra vulgaris TaxID=6087 RepID=A0ABM4BQM8_HYDVU
MDLRINTKHNRYPYCVVWTPIPMLTWLFPFIGHMGIAYSSGIIRDFSGSYYVSEDDFGFGNPTKYIQFNPSNVTENNWDQAISSASEEYKHRMHNLCCDNCHSHVAMALNLMGYNGKTSWNMVNLALQMFVFGKYTTICGFLKSWLPFLIMLLIIITVMTTYKYS